MSMDNMGTKVNEMTTLSTSVQELKGLQELLTPLIDEVHSLKENMDCNYNRLDEKYSQLEKSISTQKEDTMKDFKDLKELLLRQQDEITQKVSSQIETSNSSINAPWEENKILKWQYSLLNDRLNKIETNQLSNNIIITGVPEEPWETYSSTQQCVFDVISSAIQDKFPDKDSAITEAKRFEITYCMRVGKHRMGTDQVISVAIKHKGDKDRLMSVKLNLPRGIYVNNEFPPHVKRNRDRLRPILRLARSNPSYKDKCKLEGDSLVIDGRRHTANEIGNLPSELAAFQSVQKTDDQYLAFHGEWSLFSNFHHSPFMIDGQYYHSAEQWIQSHKTLLSGDSYTANLILKADTPLECKKIRIPSEWI